MARTVSLTTLQNRALQRANLEFASNNNLFTTSELTDNLNEGIAELYNLILETEGQDHYLASVSFQTTGQVGTYAIGPGQAINVSDFYRLKGFDIAFGQNIVLTARPFMWNERNRYKWYPGWVYTQPIFYRMTGKSSAVANSALDSVTFIPSPSGAFTITMWYHPTPPKLVSGTDTFDGIAGLEEYAVLSAAIKLLTKQEQFEHAQVLMAERERAKDMALSASIRDADEPERVRDVSLNSYGTNWYPGTT